MMYIKNSLIIKYKLLSILTLIFLVTNVLANTKDTRPYELEYANKALTNIYKKIFLKLNLSDQLQLKKAQRAWIVFRDLDCTWAFGAEPLDCLIDRTISRTKELQETIFFDNNRNYKTIIDQ